MSAFLRSPSSVIVPAQRQKMLAGYFAYRASLRLEEQERRGRQKRIIAKIQQATAGWRERDAIRAAMAREAAEIRATFRAACRLYTFHKGFRAPHFEDVETARRIVVDCARDHGLLVTDILSFSRVFRINYARQEAFYRIRREIGWSLPRIGAFFNRDHSSIWHGIKKHRKRVRTVSTHLPKKSYIEAGE